MLDNLGKEVLHDILITVDFSQYYTKWRPPPSWILTNNEAPITFFPLMLFITLRILYKFYLDPTFKVFKSKLKSMPLSLFIAPVKSRAITEDSGQYDVIKQYIGKKSMSSST